MRGASSNITKPVTGSYFASVQPLEFAHRPDFERMVDVIENVVQSTGAKTNIVVDPAGDLGIQPPGQ